MKTENELNLILNNFIQNKTTEIKKENNLEIKEDTDIILHHFLKIIREISYMDLKRKIKFFKEIIDIRLTEANIYCDHFEKEKLEYPEICKKFPNYYMECQKKFYTELNNIFINF